MAEAYGKTTPTRIGGASTGGGGKDVMTHGFEQYSKHFTPDEHYEASMVHNRRVADIKHDPGIPANRKKVLMEHHSKMYREHIKRSKI
jgi:hypothetical protein